MIKRVFGLNEAKEVSSRGRARRKKYLKSKAGKCMIAQAGKKMEDK